MPSTCPIEIEALFSFYNRMASMTGTDLLQAKKLCKSTEGISEIKSIQEVAFDIRVKTICNYEYSTHPNQINDLRGCLQWDWHMFENINTDQRIIFGQ